MAPSISVLLSRIKRGLRKIRSEPYEWLVLVGDRLVVASVLTLLFGVSVVVLQLTEYVAVTDTTRMLYLFQGLIAGNLTLVTIVLSINQLVLSREFKTPGELDAQIESVIDFRDHVKEQANRPSVPVTPADFLHVLFEGTYDTARRLGRAADSVENDQVSDDIETLVSELTSHLDQISDILSYSQDGIFSALAVTLDTNYSYQLNEAFRIRTEHEGELPDSVDTLLEELARELKQLDISRQYFKSVYMQSELARLSRMLLYFGVPAIASGILLLLVYASAADPPLHMHYLRVVVPVVVILGFTPLALLFSFILRIAMVAQRTVAITPFTTPPQETAFDER